MSELVWRKYTKKENIPLDTLILCEVLKRDETEFVSGMFFESNGGQSSMGIIGGHFDFDETIIRWADISHLLPESTNVLSES